MSINIYISIDNQPSFKLTVSPNETIIDVKKKARKIEPFFLFYDMNHNGKKLEDDKTINYYQIREGDKLDIISESVGASIDNLKNEVDTNIGFDMNLIKRNELNVNLIHFDLRMTNNENYGYYNKFKVDVVGGFYALDDLTIFKEYLEKIKQKNIPFIVITSGSSGKDVIPICKQYSFIKEVIIFCMNYTYNEHYIKEYPGYVNKVLTSITSVYDYIKSIGANKYNEGIQKFKFSQQDIQMDKQIDLCPVITASEYDNCYFLIHRAYSHFFGDINNKNEYPIFNENSFNKIKESLNKINSDKKSNIISKFESLINITNNNTFVERGVREYTAEGGFCYLYNRIMRNFEPGLIPFAYYMGPFLFGLNKYVKENPDCSISKDMILYRYMEIPKIDFYLYKLNVGHIICFPSLTSTSLGQINFTPTDLAKSYNKTDYKSKELINIKMLINYKYNKENISPGMILDSKVGHDGQNLSHFTSEREVILFPFTFLRINNIKNNPEKIDGKIIELEIINRTSYIEYTLKKNVENRFLFSNLN